MFHRAALVISLASWNPRGKQFLLRHLEKTIGPGWHKTADGIMLRTAYSDPQTLVFFRPSDNPVLDQAIRSLPQGGAFVDIGANIGYYSLAAARVVGCDGRCLAFEPSAREFVTLLANREANDAHNVIAVNCALFECETTLTLATSPRHRGLNAIGNLESESFSPGRSELVAAFSGDTVIGPLLGPGPIDLVKIDVEGAELKVLRGMRRLLERRSVSMFCVEVTPRYLQRNGDTAAELYSLMKSAGYSPQATSTAWQYDELFVRD